jgi:hypothetical protein
MLRKLDVQAVSPERALALVMADLVAIDQLSGRQLEEISRSDEWDFQGLTDAELAGVARGELVPSRRGYRRKRPG